MKNAEHNVTRLNILEAIRSGQELLNSIAADSYSDNTPIDSVKLTHKQYYSRLSKLIKVDLIKRKSQSGRYLLTPFGRVIYGVQLGFGHAVDDHLKTEILIVDNYPTMADKKACTKTKRKVDLVSSHSDNERENGPLAARRFRSIGPVQKR
jgi:hypothetical protein